MPFAEDGLEDVDAEPRKFLAYFAKKPARLFRGAVGFAKKKRIAFKNKMVLLEEEADYLNRLYKREL